MTDQKSLRVIVRDVDGGHYDAEMELDLERDFGGVMPAAGDLYVETFRHGKEGPWLHRVHRVLHRAVIHDQAAPRLAVVMEHLEELDETLKDALALHHPLSG